MNHEIRLGIFLDVKKEILIFIILKTYISLLLIIIFLKGYIYLVFPMVTADSKTIRNCVGT